MLNLQILFFYNSVSTYWVVCSIIMVNFGKINVPHVQNKDVMEASINSVTATDMSNR